ncbi:MAG: hypothetical protein PHX61_13745, partial [Alphaproteobacteria bacterium]|nr:hypothetical protein [Alphaproteobacteria bacterium]
MLAFEALGGKLIADKTPYPMRACQNSFLFVISRGRIFVPFFAKLFDKCLVTNEFSKRWPKKNSLSLKLLIATWAVSSLATLILTAGQLLLDYRRDFEKLQNNFTIIQNTYLDSMAEHLWSYDTRLLEIQLDGISRLNGISYLSLVADDKNIYQFGSSDPQIQSHRQFAIVHKNTKEVLGHLNVELDIQSLRASYIKQAFWIFIGQGAKTLVVVFVLYYIFNQ